MSRLIKLDVDQGTGIARIVLDRPERRNALSGKLVAELSEAFASLNADSTVRVIAISGSGPDFCAGADLEEVRDSVARGPLASLSDADALGSLFIQMRRLDKPIVAVVRGRALAGGCGLATACDLVLAEESAAFGYPEVRLGFVAAMVMAILRRSTGESRAFELLSLGERVTATEARRLGIVNRVFPVAGFDQEVDSFLSDLASRSASAVSLTKRLLYQIDGADFEAAIHAGAQVNALARETEDCKAGIARFLEHRKTEATGHE